jgi:hypothetical protein
VLARFTAPSLAFGGTRLAPSRATIVGPTQDFFDTAGGRTVLWLGDVDYRFDLRALVASGIDVSSGACRFSVIDLYGRRYDVRLDLRNYR